MICRRGEPFTTTSGGGGATAHGRKSTTPCGPGCGEPRVANLNPAVLSWIPGRRTALHMPTTTTPRQIGTATGGRPTVQLNATTVVKPEIALAQIEKDTAPTKTV